ncbi:carbohydrate ABC transporter permease [Micromonospora endolithica]|uniref:carbohydrate ABC transporter permease n=1 Tax=Micromonospora endolithica TaxID=230091 RepID=UPI0011AD4B42|nr:hypothetical protein [Micromonospora endolithica]TWJ25693.1 multiple sugar transport system permease protein [Micromonospora endolithica]
MADVIEVGAARGDAPPPAAGPARRKTPVKRTGRAIPYLFLAPYLVLFGVFGLLPIVLGLWLSVHQWDFQLPNRPFVGLDNYQDLFSSESAIYSDWWQSVRATGSSRSSRCRCSWWCRWGWRCC